MPSSLKEYERLVALGKEIHLFSSISQLLEWDQETYLPKGGAEVRASQLELLASLTHQKQISSSFKKTLSKLIQLRSGKIVGKGLSQSQKRALTVWRKDFLNEERLPSSFVKALAKTTSEAGFAWKTAKQENCFSFLAPHLKKIIELNKEKGRLLNHKIH
ncbi:MAG: carboxypeptidase M32, partial [Simkania negevensis]|nr:carboxypeptidase M32 [Simkania negevensis]